MYRIASNRYTKYLARLRDNYITHTGFITIAMFPTTENSFDLYNDPAPQYSYENCKIIQCVPRYDKEYMILGKFGSSIEQTPMEVISRVKDHIPNDTIIKFILPQSEDTENSYINSYFKVMSSEERHLERMYKRVLKVLPYRPFKNYEDVVKFFAGSGYTGSYDDLQVIINNLNNNKEDENLLFINDIFFGMYPSLLTKFTLGSLEVADLDFLKSGKDALSEKDLVIQEIDTYSKYNNLDNKVTNPYEELNS